MGKFQVISHPLIQHKLSILRREDTSTKDFRELVNEIAMLMGYEVSRDLPLEEVEIHTLLRWNQHGFKIAILIYIYLQPSDTFVRCFVP